MRSPLWNIAGREALHEREAREVILRGIDAHRLGTNSFWVTIRFADYSLRQLGSSIRFAANIRIFASWRIFGDYSPKTMIFVDFSKKIRKNLDESREKLEIS